MDGEAQDVHFGPRRADPPRDNSPSRARLRQRLCATPWTPQFPGPTPGSSHQARAGTEVQTAAASPARAGQSPYSPAADAPWRKVSAKQGAAAKPLGRPPARAADQVQGDADEEGAPAQPQ
eukprot:16208384-Heterocapsa_arctica.AAC.1